MRFRPGFILFIVLAIPILSRAQLPGPPPNAASLGEYVFNVPSGWTPQQYPDGIVLSAPPSNINERCLLQIWPMRPASGNLLGDANSSFAQIFSTYQLQHQTSRGSSLPPVMIHGLSGQGWEYLIVKRGIRHPGLAPNGQPWETFVGFVFVAKLNNRVAVISGLSRDSLVSNCFGELGRDVWPGFFYSLSFRNWQAVDQTQTMRKLLAGEWIAATATAGDKITFAGNGRFANAAAAQQYHLTATELITTTQAYFGNGTYTLRGNAITLTQDDKRVDHGFFRVEQESKDEGRTWSDVLYLLRTSSVDGKEYELRFQRNR